jgi:catechol 2,3-dioxygenase-like lactoylglutathione lyase family enzyme
MDGVFAGVHHVKLPVSNVARSREWYGRVLGLRTVLEFVEDDVLMGVALGDAGSTLQVALRHDPARAAAWAGFDPVALRVPGTADLPAWLARLNELGAPHGGIVTGHAGQVIVGLHDPDGIEIRLYADTKDVDVDNDQG